MTRFERLMRPFLAESRRRRAAAAAADPRYWTRVDPERVVPDPKKTLREGAVLAWGRRGSVALALEVDRAVKALGVAVDVPWAKLPEEARRAILFGTDAGAHRITDLRLAETASLLPLLLVILVIGIAPATVMSKAQSVAAQLASPRTLAAPALPAAPALASIESTHGK